MEVIAFSVNFLSFTIIKYGFQYRLTEFVSLPKDYSAFSDIIQLQNIAGFN